MLSVAVPASFDVDTKFPPKATTNMLSGNKVTHFQEHIQTKGSGVFLKANIEIFALNYLDFCELACLATNI